ncbi:hypothetical protein MTO96_019985 [Rhipicephalus appendiculatus]
MGPNGNGPWSADYTYTVMLALQKALLDLDFFVAMDPDKLGVFFFNAVSVYFPVGHAIALAAYVEGRSPVPADNRSANDEGHDGAAKENSMPAETGNSIDVGVEETSEEACQDTAPKADEEIDEDADENADEIFDEKVGVYFVPVDFWGDNDGVQVVDSAKEYLGE